MKNLVVSLALVALPSVAVAQTGIDGVIGAEWSGPGVTTRSVLFNSSAATSNFGAPTNETSGAAYDTYFRTDGTWVYFAVATNGTGGTSAGQFANLYFDTIGTGSTVGLEVTLDNFFRPGIAGSYNNLSLPLGQRAVYDSSIAGVIEGAIPLSFFLTDPLGMTFPTPTTRIRWNLSQSFGYSVAGGQAFYGSDRLGIVLVPAPTAAALLGLGGLLAARRRR